MAKGKRKRKKGSDKNKQASWRTVKNGETAQMAIFDPSAASIRKNKEYLELKREIALKGRRYNT